MRISDWSSDVCSSDLVRVDRGFGRVRLHCCELAREVGEEDVGQGAHAAFLHVATAARYVTSQPMAASIMRSCASGRRSPMARRFTLRYGSNRSEEHTSELQSLMRISYAVFCLKKNTNKKYTNNHTQNFKIKRLKDNPS